MDWMKGAGQTTFFLSSALPYFLILLRHVVFVGEPPLGPRLDFYRISLR
jgi:hypothetical protein